MVEMTSFFLGEFSRPISPHKSLVRVEEVTHVSHLHKCAYLATWLVGWGGCVILCVWMGLCYFVCVEEGV